MKRFVILAAAAALAFVSCSKNEDVQTYEPDLNRPVSFTVSNLAVEMTKADAISNNSHVAIFAGAPISRNNVKMTVTMEPNANSGLLTPTVANSLLWAVGQTTEATKFLAVYPFENERDLIGADEAEKYVDYNIASAADVEYANVFLAAAASQAPGTDETPASVALAFKHPFAKLVYTIDNQSDDFVSAVSISGIRRTGHLMFATGEVTTTGEPVAADAAVALNANGENSYMTIVMPETEAVNPVVTIDMVSGAKYTYHLTEGIALVAGKLYTANITITGSHGTEQSDRTVVGSFTITDWDTVNSGDLSGGVTTEAPKWWYLEGNIDEVSGTTDGNWDTHIPFRCVGATIWTVDFYYAGGTSVDEGFKIRNAESFTDWSDSWGKDIVIDANAIDPENGLLVEGLSQGGVNMRINAVGTYRIRFYTDTHNYHIYKIN